MFANEIQTFLEAHKCAQASRTAHTNKHFTNGVGTQKKIGILFDSCSESVEAPSRALRCATLSCMETV